MLKDARRFSSVAVFILSVGLLSLSPVVISEASAGEAPIPFLSSCSAGSRNWASIASSSDGTRLAAVDQPLSYGVGLIYTSADAGATWSADPSSSAVGWAAVASSSDGTTLAAVAYGGYISVSTDSGTTWSTHANSSGFGYWASIASSADGTRLAALDGQGYVAISTDSGVTWSRKTGVLGAGFWGSIASSSDGAKLAAASEGGPIFTSSDSGTTWTERTSAGSRNWYSIASSSDGTTLAAVVRGGSVYTSADSGMTWTEQTSAGSRSWNSVASSSDGTRLAAVEDGGSIYTSADSGATWTQQTSAGSRRWTSIASSSDGMKYAAVVYGGSIYTSTAFNLPITESNAVVASPITGATPATSVVSPCEYSATVSWSPAVPSAFAAATSYTATVVVTPAAGYTLTGVSADFFTVNGHAATTGNLADAGRFTYQFPVALWTQQTSAGSRSWISIASSSDGTKLAAADYRGFIYTSADSGATWSTNSDASGVHYWNAIASSSDGTQLVALESGGYIYTSADSGAHWTQATGAGTGGWYSIASSSDGTKLAAGVYGGYIYTSTDSGATWSTNAGSSGTDNWDSIASSSDGTKLVADARGGPIYTSTDSGVTWTPRTGAGYRGWHGIASSSDGTKLAAVNNGGYIYTSTDSGVTWTEQTSAGSRRWISIASSSDGTKLVAVVSSGYVYASADSGVTWTEQTDAGSRTWNAISSSSDGTKLAVAGDEYIYTFNSEPPVSPVIDLYVVPDTQSVTYGGPVPSYTYSLHTESVSGPLVTPASVGTLACSSGYVPFDATTGQVSNSPQTISCTGGSAVGYNFIETATSRLTIQKASLACSVTGYSVTYDGTPQSAQASCTGVAGAPVAVTVTGTTHTNANTYADIAVISDAIGNYETASVLVTDVIRQLQLNIVYTGSQWTDTKTGITLSASGLRATCTGTVTFTTDVNPVTGDTVTAWSESYTVPSASSKLVPAPGPGWKPGAYLMTATYVGDGNCSPSSDIAGFTVTVGTPGSAWGGGYVNYMPGRGNFGFEVQTFSKSGTNPAYVKGQLVWVLKSGWKFKGTLTAYSVSNGAGTAKGSGWLYFWSKTATGGNWVAATSGASTVTIGFTQTTASTKTKAQTLGSFGISFGGVKVSLSPALPNYPVQTISYGNIRMN